MKNMNAKKPKNYYFINKTGLIIEVPFKICMSNLEEARKIAVQKSYGAVDYIGTSKNDTNQQQWFETFFE